MSKLPSEVVSLDVHFSCNLEDISIGYFSYAYTAAEAYQKHGVLPYPGALSEQPAKMVDIIQVFEQLKQERDIKAQEEQQREMAKQNRKRK